MTHQSGDGHRDGSLLYGLRAQQFDDFGPDWKDNVYKCIGARYVTLAPTQWGYGDAPYRSDSELNKDGWN